MNSSRTPNILAVAVVALLIGAVGVLSHVLDDSGKVHADTTPTWETVVPTESSNIPFPATGDNTASGRATVARLRTPEGYIYLVVVTVKSVPTTTVTIYIPGH